MLAKELIDKYNTGNCTDEERALVESWFEQELGKQPEVQLSAQRLELIKQKMPWIPKAKIRTFNYRWAVAAAVLLSLAISVYIWQYSYPAFNPEAPIFTKRASVVLPNGQQITLDNKLDPNDSILLRQNGLAVSMDGTIRLMDESMGHLEPKEVMTRIETPRGGEYSVELSDGTVVQLNAESSLEFPVQFVGDQRQVKLRGEAYFDVVKDAKRPFIVNADDRMGVKVLGTSFNVSTYTDVVYTTLVEGSVRVNKLNSKNQGGMVIKPGETASLKGGGDLKLESVDLDKAIAWKYGLFNFNNSTLQTVGEELERWYNINVVVDPAIADVKFYGEFERDQPLATTIKLLEAVGVKANIKGNTLRLDEN
ncbi:FecR family protein [Sphingobacterium nematocida]|uniref:FecR family protein n=1 Tax=Sphingobacterium nematocida TaxID=1513896 RepID=A0A1T5FGV4_9SPHI|nr:FecR domain-containing protein [Sphingobacterium nematocida]SKB95318.1 FecR family protein [Sphingobacterium nematocida]